MKIKGKAINLGRHQTQQEAAIVRAEAAYSHFDSYEVRICQKPISH